MTSPTPTVETALATPEYHLFAFEGDRAVVVPMDRAAYQRSIFLDRRISAARPQGFEFPVGALTSHLDAHPVARSRTGWIFHVAHCGSTLLARALDHPERSLVLREPLALRQLGVQRAPAAAAWRQKLQLATSLYGRRYQPDAPAIVKANVPVNFIASEILELDSSSPAIFLYFPLRNYLSAILRSDGHRQWVMNVTTQLQPLLAGASGAFPGSDVAERAAALWLAQMRLYASALGRFPQARSLHAEDLFNAPREVVAAAAQHFAIGLSDAEVEDIVAGPLFATYAKAPGEKFDNEARLALQAESQRRLGPELERARRWVEARLGPQPLPERLGSALVGTGPLLLDPR
jgi:hypothetical protein